MGYSTHELGTINMFYSLKKISYYTPFLSQTVTSSQRPTYFCSQGGPLWRGSTVLSKLDMTQYIKYLKPVYKERGLYPCARVILASVLKLALIYEQILLKGLPYHPGQLYQLYWRVFVMREILCNVQDLR